MKDFDWLTFFPFPFIIVGLLFLGLGTYGVIMTYDNYSGKKETTAIITRVSKTYSTNIDDDVNYEIYVKYEIDGKEYQSSFGGYVIGFKPGKKIKIYYDPDNPKDIGNKITDAGIFIIPVCGLISFAFGCLFIYGTFKGKSGKQILAKYIETIVDTSIEVDGKNPYAIICEWTDPKTNEVRTFKSEPIWNNPEDYIKENDIDEFTVELNKNDYEVDVKAIKYRRYG